MKKVSLQLLIIAGSFRSFRAIAERIRKYPHFSAYQFSAARRIDTAAAASVANN